MSKKIIETILSKGFIAALNFLIFILTAKYTGAVGRGEISLMYLNVSIIVMFSDLIGGSALIYLIPKLGVRKIFFPAFLIASISGIVLPLVFNCFLHENITYLFWFIILSVITNLNSVSNNILIGLDKIRYNNVITILKVILIFGVLYYSIFFRDQNTPDVYYLSLLVGCLVYFSLSIITYYKMMAPVEYNIIYKTIREILSYGFVVQAGNFIQLLNYRLCFYFIDFFFPKEGKYMVGVFSTGASIVESCWVIMNGIALVQYAAISNQHAADKKNIRFSIHLSKVSFLLSAAFVLIIIFLPNSLFVYFFGTEFSDMKTVIYLLSPGIIMMAITGIYAHYFSGTGLMKISTHASLLGLIVSVLGGLLLIPAYGFYGAAITSTISYIMSSLYLAVSFRKKTGCSLKDQFFDYKNIFKFRSLQEF